jgi:hypothetical protein
MVRSTSNRLGHNAAVMLVTPNDKVDTVVKEALWYSWSWRVWDTSDE